MTQGTHTSVSATGVMSCLAPCAAVGSYIGGGPCVAIRWVARAPAPSPNTCGSTRSAPEHPAA
eukprot:364416-Chlamydomonas_euryale.AAC.23